MDMQGLLHPHIGTTIDRIRGHKVVLAVQDTTRLSYTAHASKDMGPINAKSGQSRRLDCEPLKAVLKPWAT
jgi:hypothetical protein